MHRVAATGLSTLLLLAVATAPSQVATFTPIDPDGLRARLAIPRTGPVPGGIYQILWGAHRYPGLLDDAREKVGAAPAYVTFYRDLGRPYPHAVCQAVLDRGAVPVISMELHHWGDGDTSRLDAIVAGAYDAFFAEYAEDARQSGQLTLFRFGFEMNGDWFSWGMQPEAFKAAWRHVHGIFRDAGCENLLWTWAPNSISGPDTPDNAMEKYWPGADVVDVIGLDGYNFGDAHSRWHAWQSFEEIFAGALEKIAAAELDMPVLITEFGCTHDGGADRRATWIREAYRYLEGRPEVVGAIWFNYDKRREGEKDWRLWGDEATRRAWLETFGA